MYYIVRKSKDIQIVHSEDEDDQDDRQTWGQGDDYAEDDDDEQTYQMTGELRANRFISNHLIQYCLFLCYCMNKRCTGNQSL